ncbi:hypothetical protein [Haloimpatiens massiliensis]|uniref:hypothetical protein n=1 Tax=Haloimpatiens massiliensis TaxID=1658110 RepID=UPI000C81BF19|nr:hypothetical protein [Haloimpatiens massiliensis]
MENTTIKINGLISQKQLNNYNIQYPCREICKSYHITLPENKPNIQLILELSLNAEISNWKHIFTHGKNKIFIEGLLNSRIFFKSNLYSKNIYYTEFSRPLSEILPVENINITSLTPAIFIEEAFINRINKKSFSISALMLICTVLNNNNSSKENINVSSKDNLQTHIENIDTSLKNNSQIPIENIDTSLKNNSQIPIENIDTSLKNNSQIPIENIDTSLKSNSQIPIENTDTSLKNNSQIPIENTDTSLKSNLQIPIENTDTSLKNNLQIPIENTDTSLKSNLQIPAEIIDTSLKSASKEQNENSININIEYDMNTSEEHLK